MATFYMMLIVLSSCVYTGFTQYLPLHPHLPESHTGFANKHNITDFYLKVHRTLAANPEWMYSEAMADSLKDKEEKNLDISPTCREHMLKVITDFPQSYTLRFVDSLGKPPSGLLLGNVQWLGSFDQCRSIEVLENTKPLFSGKYCTTRLAELVGIQIGVCVPDSCNELDVTILVNAVLDALVGTAGIEAYETDCVEDVDWDDTDTVAVVLCGVVVVLVIMSTLFDMGVRMYRSTRVNYSVSTKRQPSAPPITDMSLSRDVELRSVRPMNRPSRAYDNLAVVTGDGIATVSAHTLEPPPDYESTPPAVMVQDNTGSRVVLVNRRSHVTSGTRDSLYNDPIASGFQEYQYPELTEDKEVEEATKVSAEIRVFTSFSLITNGEKLCDTGSSPPHLRCLNGMRVLSAAWAVLVHTYVFFPAFSENVIELKSSLPKDWSFMAVYYGLFAGDTFFFLSGFLVSYITITRLKKDKGRINWLVFYIYRFIRLTPVYMFVLFMFITIFVQMLSGPYQDLSRDVLNTEQCDKWWWTNLIYINNFHPDFEDVCMQWTWYLADDMQFYIISPIFIYVLYRWRKVGWLLVSCGVLSCLLANGIMSAIHDLNPVYLPRMELTPEQSKYTASLYLRPYYRIAPYLVGILIADLVVNSKKHKHSKCYVQFLVFVGWVLSVGLITAVVYGLFPYYNDEELMSPDWLADLYISSSRFAWALALGWVTYACTTGWGGPINWLLSGRLWEPLSRLTYTIYLVHIIVMATYLYNAKQVFFINNWTISWMFVGHLGITLAVSIILHLTVEAPINRLAKLVTGR